MLVAQEEVEIVRNLFSAQVAPRTASVNSLLRLLLLNIGSLKKLKKIFYLYFYSIQQKGKTNAFCSILFIIFSKWFVSKVDLIFFNKIIYYILYKNKFLNVWQHISYSLC